MHANLAGGFFEDATFTGANLTRADLTGADLRRAELTRADLTGAHLTRADLTGAHVTDANLADADLGQDGVFVRGLDLGHFITELSPGMKKNFLDGQRDFLDSLSRQDLAKFNLTPEKLAKFRRGD
jgi:uncharacterized protein YjbI with pentapeptide repeats